MNLNELLEETVELQSKDWHKKLAGKQQRLLDQLGVSPELKRTLMRDQDEPADDENDSGHG
ncbi:hypothetical protein [Salinisphaera orenii]|uniref:hypothetical protein n=1 Tax=Salinisphaera orenii TaxID=856731 RepID=UPI000DBE5020